MKCATKTGLSVLIFIAILFGSIAPTFAQQYDEYINLFQNGPITSKINVLKKFDPGTTATSVTINLKLQFISSFDLSIGGGAPKKWHWDHIKDFDGGGSDGGSVGSRSFIMRLCDAGDPNENNCHFAIIPHKSQMQSDPGFCQNGVCNFPDQSTQSVSKIYHYTAVANNGIPTEGVQNDKFNVVFNADSFSALNNGSLGSSVSLNNLMQIGDQKTYNLDFWYCAVKGTSDLPTTEASSSIRFFGGLCGNDRPYIKIAETSFKLPNTAAEAVAESTSSGVAETVNSAPDQGDGLPECSMTDGNFGSGSFMGCIARLIYYVIYWPISWFAGLMGTIFDFFLGYSLSDASYRADFAVNGWRLVRDMSNIFFILILVWTGLSVVFGSSKANMKSVVAQLIINALLINFSLFGTRVIIDLSNVVARVFYNSVHVCKGECKEGSDGTITNFLTGAGGYKSLSTKIVSSFKPQNIFNVKTLASNEQVGGAQNTKQRSESDIAGYFIIVSLIAAAIMFTIAMMFWKVAFMFLGRVIGLYIAMIFAPFAVLTKGNMPLVGGIEGINWSGWWNDLVKYAMLAPIFVFFLYIIYSFLDSGFLNIITLDLDKSFFTTVISIAIPMLIIYFMMSKGVSIAEKYAGDIAKKVQGFAQKATGMVGGAALGVATGGVALAGTRFGSRIGKAVGKTRLGKWAATGDSRVARYANQALNWTQTSSWDVRKSRLGAIAQNNKLFTEMGIKMQDKVSANIGLGEKRFDGGYKGQQKRRQDEIKKNLKERTKIEYLNEDEIKKYWKDKKDEKVKDKAVYGYLEKTDEAFKKQSADKKDLEKNIKEYKKKIDDLETDIRSTNKLSEADKQKARVDLDVTQKQLAESEEKINNIQRLQLQSVKKIVDDEKERDKVRETDEYKKSYDEETKKIDKEFGKVENAEDLGNAMRLQYAQELRNNSLWMKDGKQRKALWGLGALYGDGALHLMNTVLGGFNASLSAAIGSMAIPAERLKFEQEALDAATRAEIKAYKKVKGSTSKVDQYQADLDKINKKIKELVGGKLGKRPDDVTDDEASGYGDYLETHTEDLAAEAEAEKAEYEKIKDAYKKGGVGAPSKNDLKNAAKAKQKAEDEYNFFKNIKKNKESTEEKLDKEKEKNKPKD